MTPRPFRAFHFSIRFIRSKKAAAGIYGWCQCELGLFSELHNYRTENDMSKLLSTGSCGLFHTGSIHGAFKTGEQSTDWKLKKVLTALHQILPNLPARRNDYVNLSGSSRFPLPFCGTRWIEDGQVAVRAIEIWDDICHSGSHCLKASDSPVNVI